jgi:hypothetical protein
LSLVSRTRLRRLHTSMFGRTIIFTSINYRQTYRPSLSIALPPQIQSATCKNTIVNLRTFEFTNRMGPTGGYGTSPMPSDRILPFDSRDTLTKCAIAFPRYLEGTPFNLAGFHRLFEFPNIASLSLEPVTREMCLQLLRSPLRLTRRINSGIQSTPPLYSSYSAPQSSKASLLWISSTYLRTLSAMMFYRISTYLSVDRCFGQFALFHA